MMRLRCWEGWFSDHRRGLTREWQRLSGGHGRKDEDDIAGDE